MLFPFEHHNLAPFRVINIMKRPVSLWYHSSAHHLHYFGQNHESNRFGLNLFELIHFVNQVLNYFELQNSNQIQAFFNPFS